MTHVTSTTVLVWFDHQEYARFGNPIHLDAVVDLTVGDDHVWASPWQHAVGAPIRLRAGRHAPGTDVQHIRVRVDQLWEAHAQLEPNPRGGWRLPREGGIVPVDGMDFATPDATRDTDGLATLESIITVFRGWIAQVTVLADLPPREHDWPYGIEPLVDLTGIGPHPPRLSDWALQREANPNPTAETPEGWTIRAPFFAAVQRDWYPSDSEFAQGHPCIVDWAETKCVIACYMSRHGMYHTEGVGDPEHYVRLTAEEFIERSRQLLASPWSGFRNEQHVENPYSPLETWSDMFPHGIPDDLQGLAQAIEGT